MTSNIIDNQGYFWWHNKAIPDGKLAPDSAVPGTLIIDEQGRISLELNGVLSEKNPVEALFSSKMVPENIQGVLKGSSQRVLLMGLIKNGGSVAFSGISFEKYVADSCIVGRTPLRTGKIPEVAKLEISLKGFEDWFRTGSIESKQTRNGFTAKYKSDRKISYPVNDDKLTIEMFLEKNVFISKKEAKPTITGSLSLQEKVLIRHEFKKALSCESIKKPYLMIEDLFTLLTGSYYSIDWPTIHLKNKSLYTFYFLKSRPTTPPHEWQKCWTNFPQISDNFGEIYSTWLQKRNEIGPGFYLYLGTKRDKNLYIENKFVNLIWGLEALHRKNTKEINNNKVQEKIERIVTCLTNKRDKRWLMARLKNAHEPPLSARIYDLLRSIPLGICDRALKQFSSDCADKRNIISHFGGEHNPREDYDNFIVDLEQRSQVISLFYHAILLKEIGIDIKNIAWWFTEGYQSYSIKESLAYFGLKYLNEKPTQSPRT